MIFHVDLDAFFASIEQRDNPKLRGKPVIVGGPAASSLSPSGSIRTRLEERLPAGKPARNRGVVAAASYEARKYGIHSAIPLFKAFALCPQVILITPRFQVYEEESDKFYKILSSFTPFVEQVSIDEAYLSFYGFEEYYPDFTKLAMRVKKEIRTNIGITASIGIASHKIVAKVASNYQKPDGLTYVVKGAEKTFLHTLPLRQLPGLGIKTEEKLTRLGIKTIDQLAKFSLVKMKALFGKHGQNLWEAANGFGSEDLILNWQRKSLGAETTFLFDTNNKAFLEQTMYFLSLRVASDLRKEGKLAGGIAIKIRNQVFHTTSHQSKLLIHTNNTRFLFDQAKALLYQTWDGKTPLRLIGISTFALEKEAGAQRSFFEDIPRYGHTIEATLDRIRKKHGFWSIVPGTLTSSKTILKRRAVAH